MTVERERRHQKHREPIMREYKGICHLCDTEFADSIDHVVPVALGGSDHPDNLRPAHTKCNSRKGARHYPPWAEDNPNMWIPSHLPEKIRAKEKAERLEREKENARQAFIEKENQDAQERQWETCQRLNGQIESQGKKIRNLYFLEPKPPLVKFPHYFALTISIIVPLSMFIFAALLQNNRLQVLFIVLAHLGIVLSFLTFRFWNPTGEKVAIWIRPIIHRKKMKAFELNHAPWLKLMAQEQAKRSRLEVKQAKLSSELDRNRFDFF